VKRGVQERNRRRARRYILRDLTLEEKKVKSEKYSRAGPIPSKLNIVEEHTLRTKLGMMQ
jgi:hypothetical protein